MTQCDSCKYALIDRIGRRPVLVTCRCPGVWPEIPDDKSCPGYEKGAPVSRIVRRKGASDSGGELGE